MSNKKPFLSEQCKEIEENNRMGKTRDLFKKIRDLIKKITFQRHCKGSKNPCAPQKLSQTCL